MRSPVLVESNFALLRRLGREQGKRHWRGYGIAFLFMGIMAATTALTAYLMKDVINDVFIARKQDAIFLLSGIIVAAYTAKGFAAYGQQVTLSRVANAIVADIQRRIYAHMLKMDVQFFTDRHSSEFIARQSFIATSAGTALNLIVSSIGRDFITLIGLIAVMVAQSVLMSVIGLIAMPAAVLGVRSLIKRARKVMYTEFGSAVTIMQVIQETALGIRIVKSFTLEERLDHKMKAAIASLERAANKLAMVGSRSVPLMEALGGFAVAGVILYGGFTVVEGGQTPGSFFAFITALLMAYEPAKRLARVHIDLGASLVGVKMLYDFLDLPDRDKEDGNAAALQVTAGRVAFESVSFAYRAAEPVLRNLSFVAEPGEVTALVGHSGGGKSTIFNLLQRFYEVEGGAICIDGQRIADVSRKSLRGQIAVVSQEPFLFRGTVSENIAMGRPEASEAAILAAAQSAYAHDFICGFQNGYDTQVGEQGLQLSGGQRQRIAIARAILKDAPILLLDEATAALDSQSEREVQKALAALTKGRTTLVIAHRLQTIQWADKICVIEAGSVVEKGTHAELLARKGRYFHLYTVYQSHARPTLALVNTPSAEEILGLEPELAPAALLPRNAS